MISSSGIRSATLHQVAGRHQPEQVVKVFGDVQFSLDGELLQLHFAPDGTAWTMEDSGILRRWQAATGRQLGEHFLSDVENVWAFSPRGGLLASGGDDLTIWNANEGRLLATVPQTVWVNAVAFSARGDLLATGHDNGLVRIWDLGRGKVAAEWNEHDGPVSALAFCPLGQTLASAGEDRRILLRDLVHARTRGALVGHTDRIQALAWRPDGAILASAGWDTMARIWDAQKLEPIILLNGHAEVVSALAFSPDGQRLATADSDFIVWIWDPLAGKVLHRLRGHAGAINALAYSGDGRQLLSGGQDRRMILWDAQEGKAVSPVADPQCEVSQIALTPDGRFLALASGGLSVRVWDTTQGTPALVLSQGAPVVALAASPDGKWLATGDAKGSVSLWRVADGRLEQSWKEHRQAISALAFSPDGSTLASAGGTDGYVYLWSLGKKDPVLLVPEATDNGTVEALAFVNRTTIVAGGVDWLSTGGSEGAICLWDTAARCEVATFPEGTSRLAVRPDGKQLAAASLHQSVFLWDLTTRNLTHELTGHDGAVAALAYSPRGDRLATGGDDGTVRIWRTDNGELMAVIDLDTQVKDLVFSADGRHVYTANANTTCYCLQTPEG